MFNRIILKEFANLKVSIGCGRAERANDIIGIDIMDLGQQILWDLKNGIPLPDDSCISVLASHIIEHFTGEETLNIMDELWRVIKENGELIIITPDYTSMTAYSALHKQRLTIHYFNDFTSENIINLGHKRWLMLNKEEVPRSIDKKDLHFMMSPMK